ncbi:hypothetical protein Ms3S1_16280 [Methylosinus sp. 3S-1]
MTFRAWRNRNGLFPETKDAGGWNLFSKSDIAVVRMVVVLTGLGVSANLATSAAMQAAPVFRKLFTLDESKFPLIAVIDRDEDEPEMDVLFVSGNEVVGHVLQRVAHGAAVVVDLLTIASHVSTELLKGEYPTVLSHKETLARVLEGFAKAFENRLSDEKPQNSPKKTGRSQSRKKSK